jgi:hypothetical protein
VEPERYGDVAYDQDVRERIERSLRAVKIAARDQRIPRPLRAFVALGLLPVPGPFDEFVLIVAGALLAIFYREPLRQAWQAAAARPAGASSAVS